MRAGHSIVKMDITNIFKGMTGIGRLIHLIEIGVLSSRRLLGQLQAMHYQITTRSWVLTGINMSWGCMPY